MILPYQVHLTFDRKPYANWAIIALTILTHFLLGEMSDEDFMSLALTPDNPGGLLSYMLVHADLVHLFGNMFFLWVFGNAVCCKIGNILYAPFYLLFGICAGMVHLAISGEPTIGASGAVNGILGLYLALFPFAEVSCRLLIGSGAPSFELRGFWILLMWFAFDLWGGYRANDLVAHWAHVGGFLAGIGLGLALLKFGRIDTYDDEDPTLLDWLAGRRNMPTQD